MFFAAKMDWDEGLRALRRVPSRGYSTGFMKGEVKADDYATDAISSSGDSISTARRKIPSRPLTASGFFMCHLSRLKMTSLGEVWDVVEMLEREKGQGLLKELAGEEARVMDLGVVVRGACNA